MSRTGREAEQSGWEEDIPSPPPHMKTNHFGEKRENNVVEEEGEVRVADPVLDVAAVSRKEVVLS